MYLADDFGRETLTKQQRERSIRKARAEKQRRQNPSGFPGFDSIPPAEVEILDSDAEDWLQKFGF